MEGLERLTEAGVLVKVNSVLVPGINDQHLPEVNAAVKRQIGYVLRTHATDIKRF